jgi:hypothetical protein
MHKPTSHGSSPRPANHQISPANTAASETRSRLESRNAPHWPVMPRARASAPSTMSKSTKMVIANEPQNKSPRG